MGERAGLVAKAPEVKKEISNSLMQKTARHRSMGTSADRIRFLQRTAGNQAVSRLMKSGALQAKLRIGQPGDVYEQEADRVADEVMRMPELRVLRQVEPEEEEEEETLQSKPLTNQITPLVQVQRQEEPEEEEEEELQAKPLAEDITPLVQRQVEPEDEEEETLQTKQLTNQIVPLVQVQRQEEPEEEEEEELQAKPLAEDITPLVQRQVEPEDEEEEELQAKATSGRISEVNSNLESHIQSFKGGGQPLSENDRAFFEPRFGRDFSQVRVHADAHAAKSARAVNARAFTVGRDVVFGAEQYALGASDGRRLMAHELTHVMQQTASGSRQKANMQANGWLQRTPLEDAVRKFSRRLVGATPGGQTSLVESGQFYGGYRITEEVVQEIYKILAIYRLTRSIVRAFRSLAKATRNRNVAEFQRQRTLLLNTLLRPRSLPFDPMVRAKLTGLVGPKKRGRFYNVKTLKKLGRVVARRIWEQIKAKKTPEYKALCDKTPMGFTFACALAVGFAEKTICGEAAKAAGAFGAGSRPWGIRLNLWNKSYMRGKIKALKSALRVKDTVVHARVLSPYKGERWEREARKRRKLPATRHSIVIIGYDRDKFVFWDPDSPKTFKRDAAGRIELGKSKQPVFLTQFGRGFGFLEYDARKKRLWAPAHKKKYVVVSTTKEP